MCRLRSFSYAEHLWPVLADPGHIQQVLLNLVVNARDAMPRGGRLRIETSNILVDEQTAAAEPGARPDHYACLSITDSGCGMNAEVKARIFEPFFTTKPKDRGTGLGLATVFGIVQQAGGRITCSRTWGEHVEDLPAGQPRRTIAYRARP
jgi:hypothetical protein